MNTFPEIIDAFKGDFAEAIGIEDSHARAMKARESIPSSYWLRVVKAAEERAIKGVTLELLAALGEARQRESAQ
jgi:hypothetical protein